MADSQPEREGAQGVELENTCVGKYRCAENNEHDRQAKAKITPKKLVYNESEEENLDSSGTKGLSKGKRSERREVSSDTEGLGGPEDSLEDLNMPYKRPIPTLFTTRITRFKYHEKAKLLRNVKVHEGSKDLEDHLGIFSAVAEQEEWPLLVCYKMFRQTLSGTARNWFDDLDLKA
ncbi:hypothetical protein Tco_0491472 [Tanacetum coccineum]